MNFDPDQYKALSNDKGEECYQRENFAYQREKNLIRVKSLFIRMKFFNQDQIFLFYLCGKLNQRKCFIKKKILNRDEN